MTKKINTTTPTAKPDFTVETDRRRGIVYYTPETPQAYDWSHGTPEGAVNARAGNLKDVTRFGRSFMFAIDNPRASKLKGFLKGEGFAVQSKTLR